MKKLSIILGIVLLSSACAENNNKAQNKEQSYPNSWNYESDWSHVAMDCVEGTRQSPINISVSETVEGTHELEVQYSELTNYKLDNKKYALDISPAGELQITYEGIPYKLLQFHMHADSEHTVDGTHYPLEVHFVHQQADGTLAVLGVFFEEGASNPALQQILDQAPANLESKEVTANLNIASLLPANRNFYTYSGSLTTPGCSEIVNWIVFEEPVQASSEQIEQFLNLRSGKKNNRPVQELNERVVEFTQQS